MACEKPDTHSRLPNDNSFIPLDPRSLNLGRMGGQRISVCPGPRRGQKQNWNVHATHSLSSPVFQTQGKAPASRQSDPGLPLEHQRQALPEGPVGRQQSRERRELAGARAQLHVLALCMVSPGKLLVPYDGPNLSLHPACPPAPFPTP